MSYATVAQCVNDAAFVQRVQACVSEQGGDPQNPPRNIMWDVAGTDDIEQAYAYALSVENPNPGGDETVITDQMILSAVQPIVNPPPPEQPE